jgi:hypothetical protein
MEAWAAFCARLPATTGGDLGAINGVAEAAA